ncbi:MAG: ABC transporter ATP-binding protein [Pirellulales bacterium]|nr:ABC transporter ATP-binding protein [Pirellulales bacterium]
MPDLAIDLRDVAKTYRRRVEALRGIRMEVRAGEIFGLLGPNGAGKSTLVKIMMTVVRPNRAEGTILGQPIGQKAALARVGYLPEHLRFPPYLTGRQVLEIFAALAKVDRPTRKRRALELLNMVGLAKWADVKVGTYSKGMQQRIGLAQALMNDPELLVLDEPTDGLDPVGRREVREVLGRLRDQGKTIFLNSHLLSEVERLCDRVAILLSGKVVRQGTLDELTAGSEHFFIQLHGRPDQAMREAMRAAAPGEWAVCLTVNATEAGATKGDCPPPREAGKLATGEAVELDGNVLRIGTGDPERIQPLIDALRGRGQVIFAVWRQRQSLEDLFIQIVSDSPPQGGRQ